MHQYTCYAYTCTCSCLHWGLALYVYRLYGHNPGYYITWFASTGWTNKANGICSTCYTVCGFQPIKRLERCLRYLFEIAYRRLYKARMLHSQKTIFIYYGPALMDLWSKVSPLTAICLSPRPGFESRECTKVTSDSGLGGGLRRVLRFPLQCRHLIPALNALVSKA